MVQRRHAAGGVLSVRPRALLLGALVLAGCALGAEETPLLGDRPSRAAGPFSPVSARDGGAGPPSAPFVLTESAVDLTEPSALPRPGGGWILYLERDPSPMRDGQGSTIRRVELPPALAPPGAPADVLAPDQPWEAGRVAAPDVKAVAGGFALAYETGPVAAPLVATALSTDGLAWQKRGPLGPGRTPAWLGEALLVERDGGLVRLDAGGAAEPALSPGRSPTVRPSPQPTGRLLYDLFYVCAGRKQQAICFAGSDDGTHFVASSGPAALETLGPITAPAVAGVGAGSVLFYSAVTAGRSGVAVAALGP